ncbi:MAG TPA: prolipoprotein diacylglyceryl transferase [Candidatus Polarisedimenticolia bacterium]|jgi:phosphatidylglycerol:prolipoprotein diacylglycerol transferase
MMPVLFEFHLFGWSLPVPTYGVLLAVSFLAALWVAVRQGRRAGVDQGVVTDLWIVSLISGVLGAKLLLYVVSYDYYFAHPAEILSLNSLRSAGVFYGGLLAAIATCVIMIRRRGHGVWAMGDILAPAIILGQAIGRWGCFAAGCCYGKPSSLPWPFAVTFTDPRARDVTGVPLNVALHPVQLYLSAADFLLFFILLVAARRKRFDGQILLLYLILYSVLRGTLEFLRDDDRGSIWGMSTSQALSIAVGLVALGFYAARSRGSGRAAAAGHEPGKRPGKKRPRREAAAPR